MVSSVLKIPRSEIDFNLIDDMLNIYVPAIKSVTRYLLSIKLFFKNTTNSVTYFQNIISLCIVSIQERVKMVCIRYME